MAVSAAAKQALNTAFSQLVGRLLAQGFTEAQAIATAQAQITAAIADNDTVDAGVSSTKLTSVAGVKRMVQAAIDNLVGTAPGVLDTFQEIAAALNNDPDIINSLTTTIGTKETPAGAQAKVDALAATVAATYATKVELDAGLTDLYTELSAMFDASAQ